MDIENGKAYLTPRESEATGLQSPADMAELAGVDLYTLYHERLRELDDLRSADDDELRNWERGTLARRALLLNQDRQIIDSMVTKLLEHQVSLPASAKNN